MIKYFKTKEDIESGIVIIDFFADWCRPCKNLVPILEKYDQKHGSDVNIVKIDVDEFPEIASEYSVRNIPTLLFVKNGEVQSKHVGTLSEIDLVNKVGELI